MKRKHLIKPLCAVIVTAGLITACSPAPVKQAAAPGQTNTGPLDLTIAIGQVGEIPQKDTEIELAMEKYTNTNIDFQWIPSAAYDDKVNIMIASGELPRTIKVKYVPTILNSIKSGLFWEIGPYLKDYPNLSSQLPMFYDNIKVDGKLYGIPIFVDVGRSGIVFRKDWLDKLGLKPPVTLDDWYNTAKAIATQDPDQNGQADTLALYMDKGFSGSSSGNMLTRLAVSLGAPNKWGMVNGKLTPDFMTKEFFDTVKLLRKLYDEKLINQDFSVAQGTDNDNKWNNGKLGMRIAVASTADGYRDLVQKSTPTAAVDVVPLTGPQGIRLPGEPGNAGFHVFPKSAVKTEPELKRVLKFFDQLLEEPMATLLTRGMEGKHFEKVSGGKVKFKDLSAFQRDVKPYRDNLPFFEVSGKGAPLEFTPLQDKMWKIIQDNVKYVVPNPALTLYSPTYTEKGAELDVMMVDFETKYIMGKLDDAGWQAEVDRWLKAGGSKVIDEYTAEYNKLNKK